MSENPSPSDSAAGGSRRATAVKLAAAAAVVAGLFLAGRELGAYVPRFGAWVESLGFWGPLAFVLGYAVAAVGFVPGSILTMAAGAIFGLAKGTAVVIVGATLGACAAFLVARYLARSWVEQRLEGHPRFASIDQAVARQGLKIVFLLRLSPVFPFNLLNYALGLTKVRFRDFLIACIGMLPGTFLYVYYGKALGSLAAVAGGAAPERGAADWALLGVGLVATVIVTTIVTRIARRALSQEVSDD